MPELDSARCFAHHKRSNRLRIGNLPVLFPVSREFGRGDGFRTTASNRHGLGGLETVAAQRATVLRAMISHAKRRADLAARLPPADAGPERWQSGRSRRTRNAEYAQAYRGFESSLSASAHRLLSFSQTLSGGGWQQSTNQSTFRVSVAALRLGASLLDQWPMIRVAITPAVFQAIATSLPLGTVGYEPERTATGGYFIWVERSWLNKLEALRQPGEGLSETIIRLVAMEAGGRPRRRSAELFGAKTRPAAGER